MLKRLTLGLLLLNLLTTISYPMAAANPVTRQAAREFFKKGIQKGTTALHWAIAAGPCWAIAGLHLYLPELLKKDAERDRILVGKYWSLDEWDKEVKKQENWIRQELKKQGYANWESIELIPSRDFRTAIGITKKVMAYDFDELKDVLREQKPTFLGRFREILGYKNNLEENHTQKNLIRNILSHEKTHLEKYHLEKMIVLGFCFPVFTHIAGSSLAKSLNNTLKGMQNKFKILTCFSKLAINLSTLWAFGYLAEIEADEGVINDPEILEAGAQYFKKINAEEEKLKKNRILQDDFRRAIDIHPDSLKRAQRFEERAAQLRVAEYKI